MTQGRLELPPAVLIRWRIEPLPGVDRREVMREGHRICPDLSVFDFGRIAGEEAVAWLGPLKMEVLHRLIDALMDHPPVGTVVEALAGHLQDLARFVRSPVDLIDGAEAMVEQVMLGQTARSARAEVNARIIAARFDDEPADRDAGELIRALVQVTGQAEVSQASRKLLERVGIMEPGAERPLPVADLLAGEDVMPRAQRLIVARFPLRERIPELQLDVPIADEPIVGWLAPAAALQDIEASAEAFLLANAPDRAADAFYIAGVVAAEDLEDFPRAETLLQHSLALASKHDMKQLVAAVWLTLGSVTENMDRASEAQEAYRTALALFRELQDKAQQAYTYISLGNSHLLSTSSMRHTVYTTRHSSSIECWMTVEARQVRYSCSR